MSTTNAISGNEVVRPRFLETLFNLREGKRQTLQVKRNGSSTGEFINAEFTGNFSPLTVGQESSFLPRAPKRYLANLETNGNTFNSPGFPNQRFYLPVLKQNDGSYIFWSGVELHSELASTKELYICGLSAVIDKKLAGKSDPQGWTYSLRVPVKYNGRITRVLVNGTFMGVTNPAPAFWSGVDPKVDISNVKLAMFTLTSDEYNDSIGLNGKTVYVPVSGPDSYSYYEIVPNILGSVLANDVASLLGNFPSATKKEGERDLIVQVKEGSEKVRVEVKGKYSGNFLIGIGDTPHSPQRLGFSCETLPPNLLLASFRVQSSGTNYPELDGEEVYVPVAVDKEVCQPFLASLNPTTDIAWLLGCTLFETSGISFPIAITTSGGNVEMQKATFTGSITTPSQQKLEGSKLEGNQDVKLAIFQVGDGDSKSFYYVPVLEATEGYVALEPSK